VAYRVDTGALRPPKRLADGRLRFDASLTRSGVFRYLRPDGSVRREWRDPAEVFKPESVATLEGLVVTNEHPPELINPSNAATYARGLLGEYARRDGQHLCSAIYVTDDSLRAEMTRAHRPKRQTSCGYVCELDETPGVTPDGEEYDARQYDIVYNHVAITERGRAVSSIVRTDSLSQTTPQDAAVMSDQDWSHQENNEMKMPDDIKQRMDSLGAIATEAQARAASLEKQLTDEKARADRAEGRAAELAEELKKARTDSLDPARIVEVEVQRDREKARADAAEKELASVPDRVRASVQERVKIEAGAREVLGVKDEKGKERRFDDMSDRQIIDLVVKQMSGTDVGDKTYDYAKSRFDTIVENHRVGAEALGEVSLRASVKERLERDRARADSQQRENGMVHDRDQWRQPLPNQLRRD
jgi:hypothetical protein